MMVDANPTPNRLERAQLVRQFILDHVSNHSDDIARVTAEAFGISRQAVGRHLRRLRTDGLLAATGTTRARTYELVPTEQTWSARVSPDLEEHALWLQGVAPELGDLGSNIRDICRYGFTEMVNNVIDHSEAAMLGVTLRRTAAEVVLAIMDDGVGIFRKIQASLGLADPREAVFELSKGKLTTDPDRHTGEGVFFTSKVFDEFAIMSGGLYFAHLREADDWLLDSGRRGPDRGTAVTLKINPLSTHTLTEVFDRYTTELDRPTFDRTTLALTLMGTGEPLVSRSQAKRVLARLSKFREVVLDFQGVESIGPAFADEVFRIYRSEHPGISFICIRENDEVARMIRRARAAADE